MIYGELIELGDNYAVYRYGHGPSNLTGKVKIYSDLSIEILKEPEENMNLWLGKMLAKYGKEFENNNFPEMIFFQSC